MATRVLAYFAGPRVVRHHKIFPTLTEREREILGHMARGRATPRSRPSSFLSQKTGAANHVSNIFSKLQVADRAEAIIRARDAGLVGPRHLSTGDTACPTWSSRKSVSNVGGGLFAGPCDQTARGGVSAAAAVAPPVRPEHLHECARLSRHVAVAHFPAARCDHHRRSVKMAPYRWRMHLIEFRTIEPTIR
ncbi:MAG: LuxR C-terminal-related transcriptional regulator [Thermomicrobiales bacterium]